MNLYLHNKRNLLFLSLLLVTTSLYSWGFHAHRMINKWSVLCLPPEMFAFYKLNSDYITEHAVDPDKRRYAVKEEGPRHYIDLDHYIKNNEDLSIKYLSSIIPLKWDSAKQVFGEDSLTAYGILPWHLNFMMYKLTKAFEENNPESILKLSAEIGHYAADAHVPLHTTENYNGQLTGQKGIHALWESRIPERESKNYEFDVEKASYIKNLKNGIWKVILTSHELVPYVLSTEMTLRSTFNTDAMYRPSTVGRKVTPQYTSAYVSEYAKTNGDKVKTRMIESSVFIASLWYTAWVNAGQPNLNKLGKISESKSQIKNEENLEKEHER